MSSKKTTDLIIVFENLVNDLQSYATKQKVNLSLKSKLNSLYGFQNTNQIKNQFSILIKRIINFTPHSQNVIVFLNIEKVHNMVSVQIINTGMNLFRMREIFNEITYEISVNGTLDGGTIYSIKIPLSSEKKSNLSSETTDKNNLGYVPYYKEIETKLSAYFKEIENLEIAADVKGHKEGVFLRKVNAIVQSRMSDSTFKVDALASAMALSRAQLFRKMKALTNMSPSEYLLYFRLHVARDLLKSKQNEFNVSEAGYSVGFVSKSHFTRSFHKQFSVLPSSYKNMQP